MSWSEFRKYAAQLSFIVRFTTPRCNYGTNQELCLRFDEAQSSLSFIRLEFIAAF